MSDQVTNEVLDRVMAKLGELEGAISNLADVAAGVAERLRDGDLLFKEHGYNLEVALRGVQVMLLKEATDRQIIESLADVTHALDRLSRRNAVPASDQAPPAEEVDTQPNNPIPSRDSDPGDE